MEKIQEKKTERLQIRLTYIEKQALQIKANELGTSVSELLVYSALNKKITPRISSEDLEIYRELRKYETNFSRISNIIKNNNPALYYEVKKLVIEFKTHLRKVKNGK